MKLSSPRLRRLWLPATFLLVQSGLMKADTTTAAPAAPAASQAAATGDFGPASFLPASTELYFGAHNIGAHKAAFTASRFWKKISEKAGDSITNSPKEAEQLKILGKLLQNEAFLAVPAGGSSSLKSLVKLNRLYNSLSIKAALTSPNMGQNVSPMGLISLALTDPATPEALAEFEIPPVIVGFHAGPEAPELLAKLLPAKEIDQALAKEPRVKKETMKTEAGDEFTSITLNGADFITTELKEQVLASVEEDVRTVLADALDKIATKSIVLSYGVARGEWLVFTVGKDLAALKFAAKEESLRTTAQFQKINPYAASNLAFVISSSKAALDTLLDPNPITPVLKSAAEAFGAQEAFAPAAETLAAKLPALEKAEADLIVTPATDQVAVGYFEDGLHIQSFGGYIPAELNIDAPNRFSSLITPDLLVGIASSSSPEHEQKVFTFVETFAQTVFDVTNAALASPGIDRETANNINMSMMMAVPMVKNLWEGLKEICNGTGSQNAVLLDDKGFVPEAAKNDLGEKVKFPRLTVVSDVENRQFVGDGWAKLQTTIMQVLAMSGMAPPADQELFAAKDENGITSHTLNVPNLLNQGILIGSALNDKFLAYGTDQVRNAELVAAAEGTSATENGAQILLNVAGIRELLGTFKAPDAQFTEMLEWLTVADKLTGKVWREGDEWRGEVHFKFQDLKSFE